MKRQINLHRFVGVIPTGGRSGWGNIMGWANSMGILLVGIYIINGIIIVI